MNKAAALTPAATTQLPTRHGSFILHVFESEDGTAYSALTTAQVSDGALVRVHSECETGDVFGSLKCDCGPQLEQSLKMIAQDGNGLLIYMRGHEGRGIGLVNKIRAYALQEKGADTLDANLQLGFAGDLRRYDMAARILDFLNMSKLRLITNNPAKVAAMTELGLTVTERIPLHVADNPFNKNYIDTKKKKMGHF